MSHRSFRFTRQSAGCCVLVLLSAMPWLAVGPALAQEAQPNADEAPMVEEAIAEHVPAFMLDVRVLELRLWQWLGLLVLALVAGLASWVIVALLYRLFGPLATRTRMVIDDRLLRGLLSPLRLIAAVTVFKVGAVFLELTDPAYDLLGRLELALTVAGITWMAVRSVDVLFSVAQARLEETDRAAAIAVLPLGRSAAKAFLIVVALLAVVQNLGFNVTGLIAGLGVGGIAVALAAQKTLANLLGGVSLVADQPVRVGDQCRLGGGQSGIVETVGLRSTRVRTLDRTLVTIPNAEFSEIQIENFAARDRIRLHAVLGLRYETSPDQLRYVLAEIRKLLIAHPMITREPARVRFVNFGAHSLDLELFAYVATTDHNEFLQVREDIFLKLMDIVSASGTGFAFPSQTLYLGRDGGLDADATERAEQRVRDWRERHELPFPDYSARTSASPDDPGGSTRT